MQGMDIKRKLPGMAVFCETKNFTVEARDKPHVCRTDGGHIVIRPKKPVCHRWEFDSKRAAEVMLLSMVVGEAMLKGLNNRTISVERINFQDNGNWALGEGKRPKFHLHLYGRSKDSVHQKRGEALVIPERRTKFYEKLEPLNDADIKEMLKQIKRICRKKKYQDQGFGIAEWRVTSKFNQD